MAVSKKRLDISAKAVIDNIVFSKKESWAYYRISTQVFDFLSHNQKVSAAVNLTGAFSSLMGTRQEPIEGHIIVTYVPLDVDAWEEQVRNSRDDYPKGAGFEQYMSQMRRFLKKHEFTKKVCYFGVMLGKRGALDLSTMNVFETGFKGAAVTLKDWADRIAHPLGSDVDVIEEQTFRRKEQEYFTILSNGNMRAVRCTSEELLLLIKRMFWPRMPAPYLDIDPESRFGPGDIDREAFGVVKHKYRWLKFSQMYGSEEIDGYRATISFIKFPRNSNFPNEWYPFLYLPDQMSLPFTMYSRFTLYPNTKMKADVETKRKLTKDELKNIAAGTDAFDSAMGSTPGGVNQTLEDLETITNILEEDKAPWFKATYHLVVETATEKQLRDICSQIKQTYDSTMGVTVQWTAGDQMDLFLEQMPGDYKRVKSFEQITNLAMLTTSGFNYSSDVGDRIYRTDAE